MSGNVVGPALVPLATLRDVLPEIYAQAKVKYQGREHVPQNFIPLLHCHWEDVVFLSPVHPQVLHGVLVSCGCEGLAGRTAYVIDSKDLNPARLVVYEFEEGEGRYSYYDPSHHMRYQRISEATRGYYRDAKSEGKRPFLFAGVTHAMYHGEIPIAGLPMVRVTK